MSNELRAENRQLRDHIGTLMQEPGRDVEAHLLVRIEALRAENERLTEKYDKLNAYAHKIEEEARQIAFQNERLQAALAFAEGEVKGLADERLQRENRELREREAEADAERERLLAALETSNAIRAELVEALHQSAETFAKVQFKIQPLRAAICAEHQRSNGSSVYVNPPQHERSVLRCQHPLCAVLGSDYCHSVGQVPGVEG